MDQVLCLYWVLELYTWKREIPTSEGGTSNSQVQRTRSTNSMWLEWNSVSKLCGREPFHIWIYSHEPVTIKKWCSSRCVIWHKHYHFSFLVLHISFSSRVFIFWSTKAKDKIFFYSFRYLFFGHRTTVKKAKSTSCPTCIMPKHIITQ